MSTNPYESSLHPVPPPAQKPRKWSVTLVQLLVVVGVVGLLIAMLLPAVRGSREATRRGMCSNNLKQIGIALRNYEEAYGSFPPAYTVDADGKPLHSWRTLILPYMEQKPLYDKIDLSKPWDDPANRTAYETKVSIFACPSFTGPDFHTTYLAAVGPTSCLQAGQPRLRSEITDDAGLTLIVVEVDASRAVHWMSPTDVSEHEAVDSAAADRLPHPSGSQALFADGGIRFLEAKIKPATLGAMISIAGNDDELAEDGS
jgi:type II secretory pathway pseudopilin PulG